MRIRSGNQQTQGVDTLELPADWNVAQPDSGHVSLTPGGSLPSTITVGAIQIISGTGNPNGVVTAPISSIYLQSDGGLTATVWAKVSGTGNSGWVAFSTKPVYYSEAYGASGSATATTGSITGGTSTLVVANAATFRQGQGIHVVGAGAAGVKLITTISSISGTTLTLAANASTTVVGAVVRHDDTAALQAMISAAIATGGIAEAGSGTFNITSALDFSAMGGTNVGMTFRGQGSGNIFTGLGSVGPAAATFIKNYNAGPAMTAYGTSTAGVSNLPIVSLGIEHFMIQNQQNIGASAYTIDWDYTANGCWQNDIYVDGQNFTGNGVSVTNTANGGFVQQYVICRRFSSGIGHYDGSQVTAHVDAAPNSGNGKKISCQSVDCLIHFRIGGSNRFNSSNLDTCKAVNSVVIPGSVGLDIQSAGFQTVVENFHSEGNPIGIQMASRGCKITSPQITWPLGGTPPVTTGSINSGSPNLTVADGTLFQNTDPIVVSGASATTIAAGSNGVALPTGTINVASTAGFPTSGTLIVATSNGPQTVAYTGVAGGNQFTGCTGGTGTMSTGGAISGALTTTVLSGGGTVNLVLNASATATANVSNANVGGVSSCIRYMTSGTYGNTVENASVQGLAYGVRHESTSAGNKTEGYDGGVTAALTSPVGNNAANEVDISQQFGRTGIYVTPRRREAMMSALGYLDETVTKEVGSTSYTVVSGSQQGGAIGLCAGELVTGISVEVMNTPTLMTLAKVGLCSKAQTGSVLFGVSADKSAQWMAGPGRIDHDFTAAYRVLADDLYYLTFLAVFTGTAPLLYRSSVPSSVVGNMQKSGIRLAVGVGGKADVLTGVNWAGGAGGIWLAAY